MSLLIKGMAMPSSCIVCRLECLYRIHSSTSRSEHCPLIEIKDEGFYIEELPTEFNGITMQDADYLADEFLSTTPCNRMWDAMRALRDFYENVMNDAVEIADRKTENSSEKPNNSLDKDINVRSKDCDTCKWGEWYRKGYDVTMMGDECGGCCSWNSKWTPKDEPQTYVINPQVITNDVKCFECDDFFTCDGQCDEVEDEPTGYNLTPVEDEPQTERSE